MELQQPDKSLDGRRACPFLSVVLPVRNEEKHLGAVLEQLRLQDYPQDRFEIIVADGESIDGTRTVVESFQKHCTIPVRLIKNPKQLSSAGRNVGARAARGEYVFFVDGHCVIAHSSMLRDAVALFEGTGSDCLCRPQPLTAAGNSPFQTVVANVRATPLGHGSDSTIYDMGYEGPVNPTSAGALYRKSVFSKIGYYDETFDACEDVEFNYRVFKAGLKSWISPKLTVFYHPRAGLPGLWKQMMRYGRGRCRFLRKHPDAVTVGQVVPALFLLWTLLGSMMWVFSRTFSFFFFLSLALYLGANLIFCSLLGFRYGSNEFLFSPLVFLAIHFGLGAGFLTEALAQFRRVVTSTPKGEKDDQSLSELC